MKINSGEWVTCFDLHEVEKTSSVKIDLLATLNLTRMRTCLDLLITQGYVKQYPTLRETYEQAIGVYKLDRKNPKMWERLANNEILSVFQFDTPQGIQGISLARPDSIEEMAMNMIRTYNGDMPYDVAVMLDLLIIGQEQRDLVALDLGQLRRQRLHHIAQAAGFYKGCRLGGDHSNFHTVSPRLITRG